MHCGPSGAGRFVKMIHNGIEYGLMQAYAEGFNILRGAASEELPEDQRYQLDLPDIAEVWRRGSVIGSWLLDLTAMALAEDPEALALFGVRRGFRRRPLDDQRRHRGGGAGRCPVGRALRPLPLARDRKTSPTSCCPPCATSSAAMSNRRRTDDGPGPTRASLRPRHLRGRGRSHQAPADAGALQSSTRQLVAGELRRHRRRPQQERRRRLSPASSLRAFASSPTAQ